MKRSLLMTSIAVALTGVVFGLLHQASTLNSRDANTALGVIFIFLAVEFLAHLIGSRFWRSHRADPDRAVYATLGSLAIWISILAITPVIFTILGIAPKSFLGLLIIVAIVSYGMKLRLWFIREIYELELARAASLWLASRVTMVVMAVGTFAVFSVMQ